MANKTENKPTGQIIDGIFSSSAIDKTSEMIDIEGCDISELAITGTLNWEHTQQKSGRDDESIPGLETVGKVLYAKKIFGLEDCDTERERSFWKKLKLPMIYGIARLFDGAGHPGAEALAAIIRDNHANKEPMLVRFSIEGLALERSKDDKNVITQSFAKRVALTLGPANTSAVSGLLADPNAPEGWDKLDPDDATDNLLAEFNAARDEDPSYKTLSKAETEADPLLTGEDLLAALQSIQKALDAGSYNAAPSTLTGGAALQVEHVSGPHDKKKTLNRLKAAYRDWNRFSPLDKVLKSSMPDIDPDFIDKFVELTKEAHLQKSQNRNPFVFAPLAEAAPLQTQIRKMEALVVDLRHAVTELRKDELGPQKPKSVLHNGQHVVPGEAVHNETGQKFSLLEAHPKGFVARQDNGDLALIPHEKMGKQFTLNRAPEKAQPEASVVDSKLHGHPSFVRTPEQHALVHGLDMKSPHTEAPIEQDSLQKGVNASKAFWTKNAQNKSVFVKPNDRGGSAHRDGVYHNTAHSFFGLGQYLPNQATVNHPGTSEPHSVIEAVPGAHHGELDKGDINRLKPGSFGHSTIKALGDAGELDKMAIMNKVMGNIDRHHNNYVFSQHTKPGMKLIDHGLSLQYPGMYMGEEAHPKYLTQYANASGKQLHKMPIHPEAHKWLQGLDEQKLDATLGEHGVHPDERAEAVRSLVTMKHQSAHQPDISKRHVLDSPDFPAGSKVDYGD